MHKAFYLVPIVALTALLAACGGGGGGSAKLQASDVAVVGTEHITNADFASVITQAKQTYKQQGQAFPAQGTTAYEGIKSQALTLLVQRAERRLEAKALGITVTDAQVQARLDAVKKQYFGGSEKKYEAALAKQHLTDAQVRSDFKQQLIEEKLYNKLTTNVTVSDAEAQAYYKQHISQYSQPQSRRVQYMLIKSKSLVDSLYNQLKSGSAKLWCTLAKKYSQDPSSKNNCGMATFAKGQTVKIFDTTLFSTPTGVLHAPIYDSTQYKSYFLVRPLSAIKPGKTTPFSQAKTSIKQTLAQQKKSQVITDWSTNVQKKYCSGSKITYQSGYEPGTGEGPCASLTTTNTTTT